MLKKQLLAVLTLVTSLYSPNVFAARNYTYDCVAECYGPHNTLYEIEYTVSAPNSGAAGSESAADAACHAAGYGDAYEPVGKPPGECTRRGGTGSGAGTISNSINVIVVIQN